MFWSSRKEKTEHEKTDLPKLQAFPRALYQRPWGIFRRTRGGHCVYPRLKLRYGETPACAHFRPAAAPDENLH